MQSNKLDKKISLLGIYMVVFLDVLGFGIIIPVIRDLTIFLADTSNLQLPYVVLSGILMSSYSLAQFLFAPILGSLSDRYGRKMLLAISVFGNVLSYLMWAISNDYYFFLISRLISGITGGNLSVAQSYIADVTAKKDRAKAMGMFGAVLGIGFVIGPFFGGYLSSIDVSVFNQSVFLIEFNRFSSIGLACAFLSVVNLLMIVFNLKESRPGLFLFYFKRKKDIEYDHKQSYSSSAQHIAWNFIKNISLQGISIDLKKLIIMNFLFSCSFVFLESTLAWDLLNKFGLNTQNTGILFACMGLFLVFVQGGVYRILQKKFELKRIIQFGFVISGVSLGIYPFMNNMMLFCFVLAMITFGLGIVNPSVSALISLRAEKDKQEKQGLSLGLMQSFTSLSRAVIPITATLIYDHTYHILPALSASFLVMLAFVILLSPLIEIEK